MLCLEHLLEGMVELKRTCDHDIAVDFQSSLLDLHVAAKLLSVNDVMSLKRSRRYESGLARSSVDCFIVIEDGDAHDRVWDSQWRTSGCSLWNLRQIVNRTTDRTKKVGRSVMDGWRIL